MPLAFLPVPPVVKFHYQRAVSHVQVFGEIIVGEHHKKVRCRLVPPLKPEVEVDVVGLLIVLQKTS
jgi:hypothetical protein